MVNSIVYKASGMISLAISAFTHAGDISKKDVLTQVIQLNQNTQVMLISDPKAKWAATSLTLPVGKKDDPLVLPGLFHTLEHATFLGSKNYPEGGFRKFVKDHQGWMNASTRSDNTRYHFQVRADALKEGVTRLSDLVFNPILSESSIKTAISGVDEEFSSGKNRDWLKVLSVIQENSNPKHPASKFGKGNQDSLNIEPNKLNELIRRHHNRYYRLNEMTLAIYGPQSIAALTKIVKENFTFTVKESEVEAIELEQVALFLPKQLGSLIHVETKQSTASLDIRFEVPAQDNDLNTQRYAYMKTLLESREKGSLLQQLVDQELASNLLIYSQGDRHHGVFDVYIDLTIQGRQRKDEVLAMFFQYIDFLAAATHPQYLQNELKTLELIENSALVSIDAGDWLSDITDDMQRYKQSNWLDKNHWQRSLTQSEIKGYLTYFEKQKSQMIFSSNDKLESPEISSYYDANYKVSKAYYKNIPQIETEHYAFPKKNQYLGSFKPHYFNVLEESETVLVNKPCLKISSNTKQGKGSAKVFTTINTKINGKGVNHLALLHILSSYLTSPSTLNGNQATYAGFESSTSFTHEELRLRLSGDFDNFDLFLASVISERFLTKPTKSDFTVLKNIAYVNYEELVSSPAYKQSYRNLIEYLSGDSAPSAELLTEIHHISYSEFVKFLTESFARAQVDIQILSSVPNEIVKRDFLPHFMKLKSHCDSRKNNTNGGSTEGYAALSQSVVFVIDDALSVGWVESNGTMKTRAIQSVLAKLLAQPFYQEMRMNKQLVYHVGTDFINREKSALAFTVQSSKASIEELISAIDEFIQAEVSDLKMLAKKLARAKEAIKRNPEIRPKTADKEVNWISDINQLGYQQDDFINQYLEQVNKMTPQDIKNYVTEQLNMEKVLIRKKM